jgi:hypothetical protein
MSELNDMTCAGLADVAAELALGVLTGRERAAAIAHLDTCEACREHVRQLMATGEQLRELLPPAEPPAGFETRVLARLGLSVPAEEQTARDDADDGGGDDGLRAYPPRVQAGTNTPRHRRANGETARHGAGQHGAGQHSAGQHGRSRTRPGDAKPDSARPDSARPDSARPAGAVPGGMRHGSTRRRGPGRMRRALAAAGVGLAVVAAGLGGWRLGVSSAPAAVAPASGPLISASLASASHTHVGQVFYYTGTPGWLYMSVDLGTGSGSVTCQVVGKDGRVTTIGSFQLADGKGAWGIPDPGDLGELSGARLVSANGTVLAAGTFTG